MILPFKTMIEGKPTFFMEKIWAGLGDICEKENYCIDDFHFGLMKNGFDDSLDRKPKIHTIREDKNNRWETGKTIDFFINARQKNMFRFAPRMRVVSVQSISIRHFLGHATVHIDSEFFGEIFHHGLDEIYEYTSDLETLAINDGFESLEDFFKYFNKDFHGKIIHWTNFRYEKR